jgi:phosphoribosylanthranilate isomerase
MPLRTRVKICGLTRAEDVDAAVEAGADAVGFVFVAGTPRVVSVDRARALRARVPPFVTVVGLFVNADPAEVRETVSAVRLDVVQLHGEESPEVAAACGQWARVVKAFRMKGPETLELFPAYAGVAQAYLVDAFVAGAHGGTGARFDWDLAIRAKGFGQPVILAGGLNPENAAEAVQRVGAYALDVSSGVESAPGLKDPERIKRFMAAVRG